MIKGILFDKDGTLIEFMSYWHRIIKRVLHCLKTRYGVGMKTIEEIKKVSGYLENGFEKESVIQYFATSELAELWLSVINKQEKERTILSLHQLVGLFEENAVNQDIPATALEGVKDMLLYLKEKEYYLGVATADTKQSTYHGLKSSGILEYFDYIGCNEKGLAPKPSPQMAYEFCDRFRINTGELLVVGDSVTDMEFAGNAGAQFIGIKTGYNNYHEYEKNNKVTVEKIRDIIEILKL